MFTETRDGENKRHKCLSPVGFLRLRKASQKKPWWLWTLLQVTDWTSPVLSPSDVVSSEVSGSDLKNMKQASFGIICVEILSISVKISKILWKYKFAYFFNKVEITSKISKSLVSSNSPTTTYRKGPEWWIIRSAIWTGIFSTAESAFSATNASQILCVVFKSKISDPGGGSAHTFTEWGVSLTLFPRCWALSCQPWHSLILQQPSWTKDALSCSLLGPFLEGCMLRGLQADHGIQKHCSLFVFQFKPLSDCKHFQFWEQGNTGVGEVECGTFVMAIMVTVTITSVTIQRGTTYFCLLVTREIPTLYFPR